MNGYQHILDRFVERSREILGGRLVGVYLHGSAAMGCFHGASGDLDLLAVISEYCFMDVPSDLQLILTDEGIKKESDALAAAILKYYSTHPY